MQITISKRDLSKALARCKSVANAKSTMPILGNVLLDASGESLTCRATDLSVATTVVVPCLVKKPGAIALPAAALYDRVQAMPDGDLTLTVKDSTVTIQAKGKARKFLLTGLPADDFPSLPAVDGNADTTLGTEALSRVIDSTVFAVSTDESRVHLSSALLRLNGKLTVAATDGHRLAVAESPADADAADMLVPRRSLLELRKLCDGVDDLALRYGGHYLHASADGTTLSLKLTDAQFPPYQQVIPKQRVAPMVVSREDLLGSIRAVAIAANAQTSGIKCELSGGKLRLSTSTPDGGDGTDDLDVEYDGEDRTVGISSRYLLDVLSALDCEKVAVEFSGELDPVRVTPAGATDYTAIVMPMRI